MNAETDYKKRISDALTNEDSGLLHTSLGGAANIGYSFNEIESKARHEILDNLPNNNRIRDRFYEWPITIQSLIVQGFKCMSGQNVKSTRMLLLIIT